MNHLETFESFVLIEEGREKIIKPLYKTAWDFLKRLFKKPKSTGRQIVRKVVTRSITPIGYDVLKLFNWAAEILLPKMSPKYWTTQNRMDAWYLYNGIKPKYSTFTKIGENTYKIEKFVIDVDNLQKILNNPKDKIPSIEIVKNMNFGSIHGNGMIYKGKDAKGLYIEFVDLWDLQPLKTEWLKYLPKKVREFEVSTLSGGKPFWTRNKIYYKTNPKGETKFFDETLAPLIKSQQMIKNQDFKGLVKLVMSRNLKDVSYQKAIDDWNKMQGYAHHKTAFTMFFGLIAYEYRQVLEAKEKEKQLYLKLTEYGKKRGWTLEQVKKHFSDEKGELGSGPNKKEFNEIYKSLGKDDTLFKSKFNK